jgi:hypothetical protein
LVMAFNGTYYIKFRISVEVTKNWIQNSNNSIYFGLIIHLWHIYIYIKSWLWTNSPKLSFYYSVFSFVCASFFLNYTRLILRFLNCVTIISHGPRQRAPVTGLLSDPGLFSKQAIMTFGKHIGGNITLLKDISWPFSLRTV